MSVLGGFTAACVCVAARCWPAELRDGLTREWLADLVTPPLSGAAV